MAKLVQKSGYIKSEKAGGYMKYIATREGVEKLTGNGPVTKGQRELIQKLLHDFPDAVELFEYEDYRKTPTFGTASAFITMALDANLHEINSESGYLSYIATRPRVERRGAHGLFSSAAAVDLDAAMSELEAHDGNVWTIIYSLRREDAARLGYDNADAWRGLLMMHAQDLAKAMKIPTDHFRWYAAFHNEGHHPHIHMMVWSDDPKEGFLTREGIATMRSKLTNTIFRDEMIQIYERKDVAYKELIEVAQDTMRELIQKMEHLLHSADPQFPPVADKLPSGGEGLLPRGVTPSHPVYRPLSSPAWHPAPSVREVVVRRTLASGQSQCFGREYF